MLATDYDVVLLPVTHSDSSPYNSPLVQAIEWHRLILDESHQGTGNSANKVVQQITRLQARSRWLLTGTPIGSRVETLQGQLTMLGFAFNWFGSERSARSRPSCSLYSHR